MDSNERRNELSAERVDGHVVQARDIHGDVHFHARDGSPLGRAAAELAAAVRRQWTIEAENRALWQPSPLRVRFHSTSESRQAPVHGDVREVAAVFRGLERRQLVVLGEAGSGKTVAALLLTLELLERPRAGEPVPILLAASSWDPTAEHFDTWAARRLREDYPALGNVGAYGKNAAARLVAEGRVMIVVDGLDELPAHLHTAALDGLNRAAGVRPLVVTCRTAEYRAASSGTFLRGAAVVQLAPVAWPDLADYLGGWSPVVDSPVALALSSPLMAYLARTIYSVPPGDPAELMAFGTREDVERHLLRAYLPAVYDQRPRAVDPYRSCRTPQWTFEVADRSLRFLAALPGPDFQWWQLPAAMPRLPVAALSGLVVTVGCFLVGVLVAPGWELSAELGYLTGVLGGVAVLVRGTSVRPVKLSNAWLGHGWLATLAGLLGAVELFAVLAYAGLELPGAVLMVLVWIGVFALATRRRSDPVTVPSGRTTLREDRRVCATWLVLTFTLFGASVAMQAEQLAAIPVPVVLMPMAAAGAAAALRTAWASYAVAKVWLALRRKLPWRVMAFLDDARHRGVLRANGPAYQFRHVRLREHLGG